MTTIESPAAPVAIKPGSLQEKVQTLARDRNWECLTLVFSGMGTFGALHWKCKQDHCFTRSLHNAQLLLDCPECLRLQALVNRTEAGRRKKRPAVIVDVHSIDPPVAPTKIVHEQMEEHESSLSMGKRNVERKRPVVQSRILG